VGDVISNVGVLTAGAGRGDELALAGYPHRAGDGGGRAAVGCACAR